MEPDATYFVDRDDQKAFLWRFVELGAPGQLAVVQGPDGIGKSALLETLQNDCKAAGVTSAKIELSRHEYRSDPNFLSAATDLWCSLGLGTLSELIALVTAVLTSDGSDRASGPASAGEPYETVRQEQRSSLPVPAPASPGEYGGGVRSIEGHVDHVSPGAQVAIGYNINQIQIIYGKTKNQDDARTMEPLIRRNVTMGFQRRLEQSWQLRRTVILLDSWESALSAQDTLTEAGAWICDNVLQFIVDKAPANCLVVIASGRNPQLGALERVARRVELGPLPQVAVDEYFATVVKAEASPDALAQLAAISHGIPLAMKLLAEGANAGGTIAVRAEDAASSSPNSDDVIGLALEKYLEPLPPDTVRQAVRIGAIPHRADKALLMRLGVREQDIPALLSCSFILWDDDKQHFTYHPSVRKHLLQWWDARDPKEYRRLSRIALSWFKEQSANAVSQQKPSYEFERELLYHQLIEDDVAGFNGLAGAFEDACDEYAMDRAQGFVTDAVELDQRGILTPEGRQWLEYYQARLKLLRGQEDKGEEAFLALADRAPDRFLQTLATWNLGNLRVDQHRWTEGVRHYHTGLAAFESMGETRYAVRVMLSLGHAYCDLAEASGGLLRARPEQRPGVHRIFHVVQQLPFLAYEGLLRRNRFLPNWYFGTNYQNWIIAYLLTEGAKWYRRVERERHKSGSTTLSLETQLLLAEIDYFLGRWSRARHRYARVMKSITLPPREYSYRRAQVHLGQGRILLDEGKYDKAEASLLESHRNFTHFGDKRSAAVTAELLGQVAEGRNQPEKAIDAYGESLRAYSMVNDALGTTGVVTLLEDFASEPGLPQESAAAAKRLTDEVTTRQYLARFPDKLLRWFRRVALIAALPLTFILTLLLGMAVLVQVQFIEGELLLFMRGWNAGTRFGDVVLLTAIATLPFLIPLWFYRLVYMVAGTIIVRRVGRRLSPIEQEQPHIITCSDSGISVYYPADGRKSSLAWEDVVDIVPIDYFLRGRVIELLSGSIVSAKSGDPLTLEGVASGYRHIVNLVRHRLGLATPVREQTPRHSFLFFERRSTLVVLIVALLAGIALVAAGKVHPEYWVTDPVTKEKVPDTVVFTPVAGVADTLVPMVILLGSAVTLWRVAGHQHWISKLYPGGYRSIPTWLAVLGAILLTLATVAWLVTLYNANP